MDHVKKILKHDMGELLFFFNLFDGQNKSFPFLVLKNTCTVCSFIQNHKKKMFQNKKDVRGNIYLNIMTPNFMLLFFKSNSDRVLKYITG